MKKPPFVVVVGASTGGPAVVLSLIKALKHSENIAVVIAQHLDPTYFHGFHHWLEIEGGIKLTVLRHGDHIEAGKIYLASFEGYVAIDSHGIVRLNPSLPMNSTFLISTEHLEPLERVILTELPFS